MRLAGIARIVVALVLGALVAGCAGNLKPLPPTPSPSPTPTAGPAALQTRTQLEAALRLAGFGLIQPSNPYRPAEPPSLADTPRVVYQAVIADDPTHGYVVVYELPDLATAAAAGRDLASYLASGPTRVQFPPDTRFVLRQVGTTLVLYDWSPANSTGSGTATVGQVIGTVGQGIAVGP